MNWERYFKFMQRATTAFDCKILMMGYYNSVLQMGHETFCACLAEHGGVASSWRTSRPRRQVTSSSTPMPTTYHPLSS